MAERTIFDARAIRNFCNGMLPVRTYERIYRNALRGYLREISSRSGTAHGAATVCLALAPEGQRSLPERSIRSRRSSAAPGRQFGRPSTRTSASSAESRSVRSGRPRGTHHRRRPGRGSGNGGASEIGALFSRCRRTVGTGLSASSSTGSPSAASSSSTDVRPAARLSFGRTEGNIGSLQGPTRSTRYFPDCCSTSFQRSSDVRGRKAPVHRPEIA